MTAPHLSRKTTPKITYPRMAEDTYPVFASAHVSVGYGIAEGPHARPGIPEDTSAKSQVLAPQWVASGMHGKWRKRAGRTWSSQGAVARSCDLLEAYDGIKVTRRVHYPRKTGHTG
jgi:hypothetical protein